ncbi:Ig-like domain-containing protein [Flavobacterium fluviale]|uniref:PA14 domain-containing protein n=1 Tax=Flavobacterium fluviale TaxID=2249356 RepID=A0A344LPA9_9FLAO|nr:T9SS sorting signal type C domain-containing protein [Flavobacterium fluviale]AXB55751.1 hypothetical protein HYN86_03700 [Flavobacterium fluviale]
MKKTLLLFLLLPFLGFAQVNLVKWDNPADNYAVVNAAYTNAVDAEPVGSGPDLNLAPLDYQGFRGTPWTTSFSIDQRKYFQFTVSTKTGYKVKLNTFNFTYRAENQSYLQRYQVRYSKDEFATSMLLIDEATQSGKVNKSLDLSKITLYAGEKLTIRIYGYKVKTLSDYNTPLFLINKNTVNEPGNTTPTISGTVSTYDPADLNANDDLITTQEKTAVSFNPLTNDTNHTGATITNTQPPAAEGTVSRNGNIFTFTPAAAFKGTTSFTYTLTNGAKTSTATVVVYVNELAPKLIIWNGAEQQPKAVVTDPNITGNDLSLSPPTPNQSNLSLGIYNNYFHISGLQNNGSNAETLNRYIQVSITPKDKYKLTLTQFKFSYFSPSNDEGASMFQVRYSKDPNFADNGTILLGPTTAVRGNDTEVVLNFPTGTSVTSNGNQTLYIRIYPYAVNNLYNGYFRIRNDYGGEVGPTIMGVVEPSNLITANADFASAATNTALTIPILSNDENYTPLTSITVTQPSVGGTVQVNGTTNVTFTPAQNFTGKTTFEYTIFNGINYSTATVTVNVTCQLTGDQIAFGSDQWNGYVYKLANNAAIPPNVTYPALPNSSIATYVGIVTENKNFDRNIGSGAITGVTSNFGCATAPNDRFFVRYKMRTTLAAGKYSILLAGDDGTRLYIDNQLIVTRWNDHGYVSDILLQDIAAGEHEFVIEYYENGGDARITFSCDLTKGDPTEYGDKVWNAYGYLRNDLTLTNTIYAGYYVEPTLNINSRNYWAANSSPSAAANWQGASIPNDNFTVSYKRKGFPCGQYQIQRAHYDDAIQIFIDDVEIFSRSGWDNNPALINNNVYTLNSNSRVEVRLREDGGDANVGINFLKVLTPYTGTGTLAPNSAIEINSNTTLTSDLTVCSCTINPNYTLTVKEGVTLTVDEDINVGNGGKLLIQSGGSFIQTSTSKTMFTGNSDAFELQRTTSVRRYDLTYWSMPVTKPGFTMHDLSPGTLFDKFHYYDSNAGKWGISNNGTMVMETGKGYTIRAPQSYHLMIPQDFTAVFTGVPNNGDISVPVVNTKWNLIGNPYPSAISAQQLMADNPNLGSLYFWGHEELPVRNPADNTYYYNNDYTIFNASGATTGGGGVPFNGYIAATQGFFAKPETGTIVFKNNERRAGNNSQFYKTAAAESIERNRVWLNITNTSGVFKQILFGYIQGATNSLDINYDAVSMAANSLVDFYSINTNKKLTIQGRALPFEKSDEVPLGYKLSAKGDYTISIDHADGIFNNQDVYLVDKETGKTTNLRLENYTFTTAEGSFNNRFVIRYTSKTLGTDDFENSQSGVFVSVKSKIIKVNSNTENIKEVKIYNIGGQLIYTKNKIDSNELQITNLQSSNQVLLVNVMLENDSTITKKVIFN